MTNPYEKLITVDRRRQSTIPARGILDETASDRSRIIFSSSIRRLQQKAQVFSLESNASVRTRLTHTLEVSDNGRWIASKVADSLNERQILQKNLILPFINLVETACFLHDIGNPPFGHFGESAIQKWFAKNASKVFFKSINKKGPLSNSFKLLLRDFEEFDGNPQGFRIITLLQEPPGPFRGTGLNLLKCQLFSFLKYLRAPGEVAGSGILKKPGYFNTEKHIVDDLKKHFSHQRRFPLTYLMEAADDISYCLSDIEDGIEKQIINIPEFFDALQKEYIKIAIDRAVPFGLDTFFVQRDHQAFFLFKTKLAKALIEQAAMTYLNDHDDILLGKRDQLFNVGTDAENILTALKMVSSKLLFRSREAEDMEIAGFNVISGLLEKFGTLLSLPRNKFELLINAIEDPKIVKSNKLEIEWRFFNMLPKKYVEAYNFQMKDLKFDVTIDELEWYLRAHLIVDFISGMTDGFSLELYKLFHGIETR